MNVHVVSASAGTGKTFRLTREVTRALVDGSARPEGLVAITYTRKAAAELESRIRTDLIRAGRADLAARVRDGYLGTIHSVCERLLREFALPAGHSPWLEPIAEAQRERLFAEALAAVLSGREGKIEPIAWRFGLEDWEKEALRRIVELARENGLDGAALRQAGERSIESLSAVLPPVATSEEEYRRLLSAEELERGPVEPRPRPWYDGAEMGPLGDAIHAFLAGDRWAGDRQAMASRLLTAHGVLGAVAPESLVRASDALRAFLDERFPGAAWRREWPVRARLSDRGQPRLLQGEVDLFLELPDGFVLVDHKSFPGSDRERDERVVAHAAQLGLYAFALERALTRPLRAAFIHLPIRGELVEVDVGAAVEEWRGRAG